MTVAYVYAVRRVDGAIKIGFSRHPLERIGSLGEIEKILGMKRYDSVPEAMIGERALHRSLSSFAIGNEWYDPSVEVLEAVSGIGMEEAKPIRQDWVMVSTRQSPEIIRRLRIRALERGMKLQDLVIEGLDLMLEKLGVPKEPDPDGVYRVRKGALMALGDL